MSVPGGRVGADLRAGSYKRYVVAFGIGAAWLGLAAVGVIYVGGAILSGVARGIALLPRGIVWLFVALQDGADWWSIAGRAGAALAGVITTSQVAFSLMALELVGAAALYGLQRLLRDEQARATSQEEKS